MVFRMLSVIVNKGVYNAMASASDTHWSPARRCHAGAGNCMCQAL
jgi:hypothetical protein